MEVEVGKDSPPGPKRPCMKDELRRFRPTHPHRRGDTWTDDEWQEPEDRSRIRKVAKPFEFPKPDPPSTVKNPFVSTRIHKWIFDKFPHRTWHHIFHPRNIIDKEAMLRNIGQEEKLVAGLIELLHLDSKTIFRQTIPGQTKTIRLVISISQAMRDLGYEFSYFLNLCNQTF